MSTWLPVIFQSLTLIGIFAILIVLLRKNSQKGGSLDVAQILESAKRTESAVIQLSGKQEAFASNSDRALSTLRTDLLSTLSSQSSDLRQEVVKTIASLGDQTRQTLEALRKSTTERQDQLAQDLNKGQATLLETINSRLNAFQTGTSEKFNEFQKTQLEQGNSLRTTVEQRLDNLNESNSKKLDEMRETVDEKLHKTLESRLTQSFGLVTDQLGKVQTGLGEMKELAVNVGDLKRVFNNVSTRGAVGELWLSRQLEETLAPDQFVKNARIRPNSDERVDYAIRIPNGDDEPLLLPIDAKFPKEDWERLEDAAKIGDAQGIEAARKGLETRIRMEAKKIAEKYILPPITTDFAFMYFPSEGLFSEALRIPGLTDELQLKYHVTLAAPTNFMAILNSLRLGFRTLAIQKKSSEVWQLLAATKVEFKNFGTLMALVEKQVGTVQNTIQKVHSKTRTINRQLKGVEVLEMSAPHTVPLLVVAGTEEDHSQEEPIWGAIPELTGSEEIESAEDVDENA